MSLHFMWEGITKIRRHYDDHIQVIPTKCLPFRMAPDEGGGHTVVECILHPAY